MSQGEGNELFCKLVGSLISGDSDMGGAPLEHDPDEGVGGSDFCEGLFDGLSGVIARRTALAFHLLNGDIAVGVDCDLAVRRGVKLGGRETVSGGLERVEFAVCGMFVVAVVGAFFE